VLVACPLLGVVHIEGEVDGGAAADGAFGPGPAAVTVDDALDAGQADAGAGELAGVVQPLRYILFTEGICRHPGQWLAE
jgi:hypothetical protein